MEPFIDGIINGAGIPEPEFLVRTFRKNFKKAVQVDWYHFEDRYEAIFYIDQIEYIAVFSHEGVLMEYKMFLPVEHLPASIKAGMEEKGEIMNAVLINQGNRIIYEAIIRVNKKLRKLVVLSSFGNIIDEKGL